MKSGLRALSGFGVALVTADGALAQSQVQRLRDACVATGMNRESFERAFAARGFEPLIPVVREGELFPSGWMSGYGDGGVHIVMEGQPPSSEATDCGVLDPRPEEGWQIEVERLAQELGMSPMGSNALPNVIASRSWTADGDRPLTLHYEIYREAVVVRFAKASANSQ